MADSKITELPALTAAVSEDVFPIVDLSEDKTCKMTLGTLEQVIFQDGTENIDILSGAFTDALFDNDIQINGSGNVITTLLGLIDGNTTNINNLDGSFDR